MLFLIKPTLQLKSLLGQTSFSCVGGNLIRTVSRRILSLGKDFKAFSSRQWIRDSVCPPRISSRLKEPYATNRSWWQIGGLLINLIIQPNWARVGLEAPFMIYSESFYNEKLQPHAVTPATGGKGGTCTYQSSIPNAHKGWSWPHLEGPHRHSGTKLRQHWQSSSGNTTERTNVSIRNSMMSFPGVKMFADIQSPAFPASLQSSVTCAPLRVFHN